MIRFKHLKKGMSFLEIIGALALFATFGSSLFVTQEYIFKRLSIAELKVLAHVRMHDELVHFQMDVIKDMFVHKGVAQESLQDRAKIFVAPAMDVKISAKLLQDIPQELSGKKSKLSSLENVYLVSTRCLDGEKPDSELSRLYMFMYIPQVKVTE